MTSTPAASNGLVSLVEILGFGVGQPAASSAIHARKRSKLQTTFRSSCLSKDGANFSFGAATCIAALTPIAR
jgi:hypothetical protein